MDSGKCSKFVLKVRVYVTLACNLCEPLQHALASCFAIFVSLFTLDVSTA